MLDTKFIREHVEEVKENIKNRHAKADVDAFVALDNQRRDILQKVEAMKNERNTVTKEISQLKRNKENADAQIAAMKKLGDDIDVLDKEVKKVEADMRAIQLMIPICATLGPRWQRRQRQPGSPQMGRTDEIRFPASQSLGRR